MAVADGASGVVTLRVVYYGPAGAGKTTNLERISTLIYGQASGRITPRQVGANRTASLEIPAGALGHLLGSSTVVRLETMQGEVSSVEGGWSAVLAGADGIVFVADSSPHARSANLKALAGIRERLEGRARSDGTIPVLLQWNKRDRADARPIAEMETELNHRCFPSIEAASLRGTGVAETLVEILKKAIRAAQRRAGAAVLPEPALGQAISSAIQRLSKSAREASIERFGMTIDRQPSAWPDVREPSRDHHDRDGIWSREAVYSAVSLGAESPTGPADTPVDRAGPVPAARMLAALQRVTSSPGGPDPSGLPHGLMAGLLAACDRTHGSLLLFRQGTPRMEEREVVPVGSDPLNASPFATGATAAVGLCAGPEPLWIGDLANKVFADRVAPGTGHLRAALILPLVFGSDQFGGMVVYVTDGEPPPPAEERAYWETAAALVSFYLASEAGENRAVAARRADGARAPARSEPLEL